MSSKIADARLVAELSIPGAMVPVRYVQHAIERVDQLQTALDKFGWHNFRCKALIQVEQRDPEKPCTCGYDAALTTK